MQLYSCQFFHLNIFQFFSFEIINGKKITFDFLTFEIQNFQTILDRKMTKNQSYKTLFIWIRLGSQILISKLEIKWGGRMSQILYGWSGSRTNVCGLWSQVLAPTPTQCVNNLTMARACGCLMGSSCVFF